MASALVTTDVTRIHPLFGEMQLLLDINNDTAYYRLLDEPIRCVNEALAYAILDENAITDSPLTLIVDNNSYKMFCVGSYLDNPVFRDTFERFVLFYEQNIGKWVVRTDGILARPHCSTMQYGDTTVRLGTDAYTISSLNLFPDEEETKDFSIWEESTERTVSYKSSIQDLGYFIPADDDDHIYIGQGTLENKSFRIGYGSWKYSTNILVEQVPEKQIDYILLPLTYDGDIVIYGTKGSDDGWYETNVASIKIGEAFTMEFKKNPDSTAQGSDITWEWNGFQEPKVKPTKSMWVIDSPGWR